jgi:hypothetical protein
MPPESIEDELESLLDRKPVYEVGASFPMTFFDELSIHEKAVKGSSHLSNRELKMRMLRDDGELCHRALNDDRDAASELVVLARNLANELNLLAKQTNKLVSDIAENYDEWPWCSASLTKRGMHRAGSVFSKR